MSLTAVVGINWGDEGKGRMVDLFSEQFDIVCRYQGGNNAGHTVINQRGKFVLNLLPSGILSPTTVNIMGCGMVIDIEHLHNEIQSLTQKGIQITPKNLKISHQAFISMPYDKAQDILEEERLKDKKYGSTRRGIAPTYGDKYLKKGLRMSDLLHPDSLKEKINNILEWKKMSLMGYGTSELSDNACNLTYVYEWTKKFGDFVAPFITDTTHYLNHAIEQNKNILFEAQLGALRDIDYGIYPFTTSSSTLAGYAGIGSGIPSAKLDRIIGITKAYSSCVGEGPFAVEMSGAEAEELRLAGGEYGSATGRPRRVGAFDIVATRYGILLQGANEIALTKLDVLSYMDKIPVCVGYNIDGKVTKEFPLGDELNRATPVFEYLDGFKCDISACRKKEDLPTNALNYINYLQSQIGCPIKYVSVGADREQYIVM